MRNANLFLGKELKGCEVERLKSCCFYLSENFKSHPNNTVTLQYLDIAVA